MIFLEHGFEGPFATGFYDVKDGDRKFRLSGKSASLLSLLLSGYALRDDFQPLDAFSGDSTASGRAYAKVADHDEDVRGA